MATISAKSARSTFSELVSKTAYTKERVVVTRNGKKMAALVPIEDLVLLERLEYEKDVAEARAALEEIEAEGTISWEKVQEELGL